MEIRSFDIEGVFEIIPDIYRDERGFFFESWNREKFLEKDINLNFVQDNQSFSRKNVLRGLHFQYQPFDQGKLVRVISGRALDIAVDIRTGSPTLGKYISCILDSETNNMLYMPGGFAHGFLALTDAVLFYKCTRTYKKKWEGGILWNDPDLAIDWGINSPVVSDRDNRLPSFKEYLKNL
ncbi:MAG TPA: dTDP-4-dehydrorhamnose 3,5-epimerase [Cyclobacteriaceae bacterium]|nr:dTDP-4-dehydrorhamnose 3,5-epimerase [Cyclobacteriaceae bacterium]